MFIQISCAVWMKHKLVQYTVVTSILYVNFTRGDRIKAAPDLYEALQQTFLRVSGHICKAVARSQGPISDGIKEL